MQAEFQDRNGTHRNVDNQLVLRADAASALSAVARALGELIARIPGDMRRPTDLQRVLGVDYKLCWQVFNIVHAENPLSVSQHVPGNIPIKKLLAAAGAQGVSDDVLQDVEQAIKEFRDVVATHSSDRHAFDSMVAFISGGDAAEALSIQHRRNAFRSDSQIWGTQVETCLRQMIVRKNDAGTTDSCFVNAKYGLRRLRREVMPIVHGFRDLSTGGFHQQQIIPLDPDAAQTAGMPVMQEFCTQPVPGFQTIQHSDGWIYSALVSEQVGRKSTVNLVFAGLSRGLAYDRDEHGQQVIRCAAAFIAPTELGVVELLVHRPSFGPVKPYLEVYATAAGYDVPQAMRRTQQFLIHERVTAMGSPLQTSAVAEVPRYAAQVGRVFEKIGWDPAEFDLYRVRLSYPILHTSARLVFDLPR